MELVKDVEHMSSEEQLREPGLFRPEKKESSGDPIALSNYLRGGGSQVGGESLLPGN